MIEIVRAKEKNELDLWLVGSVVLLLAIGLSMVYSASLTKSMTLYSDRAYIFRSQVFWIVVGALALVAAVGFDHRRLSGLAKPAVLAALLMMLLVFLPGLGHQVGKARRWVRVGFMVFQPSEFAKLGLVVYLADLLSRKREEVWEFGKVFLPGLLVTAAFVGMALGQTNLGTAVVFMGIAFGMFFAGGIPGRQMLWVGLSAVPVLVFAVLREPYRLRRIFAYLDPWAYPDTAGYNIIQSWRAFHNGGLLGVGWGRSLQKTGLLPAPHTDFVLAVLAEEMGLLGVLIVLGLFVVILVRGCAIAARARSPFSGLLAFGLTLMIVFQAGINMGVVTGLLPTTGLVLPFVSYGGSALVTNMAAAGILLNIHRTNVLEEDAP